MWFGINVEQFERTGETPLWVDLRVERHDYLQGHAIRAYGTTLGIHDSRWAPVALRRDVEYPEILDGVVDSLKQIADVLSQVGYQSP